MLKYRDFVPQQIKPAGFFSPEQHESFDAAVKAANDWLATQAVELVSMETVVLPNIWHTWEDGSADGHLSTSGESTSSWHQIVRVWYRD